MKYNKDITAEEARKTALAIQEQMYNLELEWVIEMIQDTVHSDGGFVLRLYNKFLRQDVQEELKRRNFQIFTASGGLNETDTIIKW